MKMGQKTHLQLEYEWHTTVFSGDRLVFWLGLGSGRSPVLDLEAGDAAEFPLVVRNQN